MYRRITSAPWAINQALTFERTAPNFPDRAGAKARKEHPASRQMALTAENTDEVVCMGCGHEFALSSVRRNAQHTLPPGDTPTPQSHQGNAL